MAQAEQPDTSSSDSRRVTSVRRKTIDRGGVNFNSTAHLSRGTVSLRRGNLFGQMPAKRMVSQIPHLPAKDDPQIGFLLSKQWTLYSVTPLYKFSYGQLQAYSRQLSLFIAAEKQKNLVMEAEPDLPYKVKFSSLSALKMTEREQASVLIQITQRSQVTAENEDDRVVWMGWFCCACGDDILETVMEDFTCLPLFLVNGAKALLDIVKTWLQQMFDCCFSPLQISPISLAWMAAMWSGCNMDKFTVATELTFSAPCPTYPLDISYAIHPEDAKALWDSIQSTEGEIRQEEVELFMECLYNHFHRHFKIHLSATRLVKVSTSVACAHSTGKIKIFHAQYLTRVLFLLTELAVSKIL
ncbi:centromere protein L [Sceloporus undulatus]|uniref:centromere protein L n=1 Tax=Sceloporus undulatus TaxID=8520 RepID=UPI001C4AA39F|nr:centromere protein L [Sceloporus undulatus]